MSAEIAELQKQLESLRQEIALLPDSTALLAETRKQIVATASSSGAWTPLFTFATPGDLTVVYSVQNGSYTRIGDLVFVTFVIATSTFTHTTATGAAAITGLPFTSKNVTNANNEGALIWQGISKGSYTDVSVRLVANSASADLVASGSTLPVSGVSALDMPSGGTVVLAGSFVYQV